MTASLQRGRGTAGKRHGMEEEFEGREHTRTVYNGHMLGMS